MKKNKKENIYIKMQKFADLTKTIIEKGQISRAKRCFHIADNYLRTGNKQMKNAVINVYLYSISSFIESQDVQHRKLLNSFPALLKQGYNNQIIASYHE